MYGIRTISGPLSVLIFLSWTVTLANEIKHCVVVYQVYIVLSWTVTLANEIKYGSVVYQV